MVQLDQFYEAAAYVILRFLVLSSQVGGVPTSVSSPSSIDVSITLSMIH